MNKRPQLDRRTFLCSAGLAASALALRRNLLAAGTSKKRPQLAIQMCSVLPSAKSDLPATLKVLQAAGYKGVEMAMTFGGLYGRKPTELRRLLDDAGLHCTGTTLDGSELDGDERKRTVDNFSVLGGRYLNQADLAVPEDQLTSRDAWLRAAERFTRIEQQLAALGFHAGLHNHEKEWAKTENGQSGWEIVFANTPPGFVHELDICHCLEGGGDPLAMIREFSGRTRLIHMKEFPRNTDAPGAEPDPWFAGRKLRRFGDGKVPWNDVLITCEESGGTEWYIMELWMGQNPLGGRDLKSARRMADFARSIMSKQA